MIDVFLFGKISEICLIRHAKATSISLSIEICCILYFSLLAHLVFDHIPVLAFNLIINFLVTRPVNIIISVFIYQRFLLEVFEFMTIQILVKRNSLRQFLQDLIASRQLHVRLDIKCHGWLETLGRYYFHTPKLIDPLLVEQFFDVLNWIFKLFFSWPKNGHFRNVLQIVVGVLSFQD